MSKDRVYIGVHLLYMGKLSGKLYTYYLHTGVASNN